MAATLTRLDVRRERRRVEFTRRHGAARTVRDKARVVADYLAAAVNDRALSEDQACALLDQLAAPVLALIRDPEEGEHDHTR